MYLHRKRSRGFLKPVSLIEQGLGCVCCVRGNLDSIAICCYVALAEFSQSS
jgi:hypothetical protein